MCAAFQISGHVFRPGRRITVVGAGGRAEFFWVGFARHEIRSWWEKRGAEFVIIPAERYAIRSEFDRQLRWVDLRRDEGISAVIDLSRSGAAVRLVTREATQEESIRFQSSRHPVIEAISAPLAPEESESARHGPPLIFL